ncbi:hypothetical protein C3V38_16890 (plasmid) [Dietzia sp. oral taxon 368]|nr:hypothetical protein C3V38_16890 [Dietzia sp. oral taxon 368]
MPGCFLQLKPEGTFAFGHTVRIQDLLAADNDCRFGGKEAGVSLRACDSGARRAIADVNEWNVGKSFVRELQGPVQGDMNLDGRPTVPVLLCFSLDSRWDVTEQRPVQCLRCDAGEYSVTCAH